MSRSYATTKYAASATSSTWYQDELPTGTIDGSNAVFTLAHSGASAVFANINGQYQYSAGQDYTLSGSNQTLTFVTPPHSGDIFRVNYVVTSGGATWYQDENPAGTIDGSNAIFTLAHTPTAVTFIYLNGQYQYSAGQDYTLSTATITFVTPPHLGDIIRVTYS